AGDPRSRRRGRSRSGCGGADEPRRAQPPSEHVVDGVTVATRTPVTHLAADRSRVAFVVSSRAADCDHVVAWTPAAKSLRRLSSPAPVACPVGGTRDYEFYDLAFAGSRAEWRDLAGCGNTCDVELSSATLERPLPQI